MTRRGMLAMIACVIMLECASAFSVGPSILPLRQHRQRAVAMKMQQEPINRGRQALLTLGPILGFVLFLEYVASPLMLQKLKAEKAEKAEKVSKQKAE